MNMRRVRLAVLAAGCAAPLVAGVVVAGPAHASSLAPYLYRSYPGSSCGSDYVSDLGNFYANRETWNSGWVFVRESVTQVGNLEDVSDYYYENGVDAYEEYAKCSNHKITYYLSPTSYSHRHRTQYWVCGSSGSGCQYISTSTTGWSSGTTFS